MSEEDERKRPRKLAHYVHASYSFSGLLAIAATIVLLIKTYFDLWVPYLLGMIGLLFVVLERVYLLVQKATAED